MCPIIRLFLSQANFWHTYMTNVGFVLDYGCRFSFTAVELKNSKGR